MLSLGNVHILREELIRISGRGMELRLVFDWPHTDLPILFGLPAHSELRFTHLAGEHVGVPVQLDRWKALAHRDCDRLMVLLSLSLPPDDKGLPIAP